MQIWKYKSDYNNSENINKKYESGHIHLVNTHRKIQLGRIQLNKYKSAIQIGKYKSEQMICKPGNTNREMYIGKYTSENTHPKIRTEHT